MEIGKALRLSSRVVALSGLLSLFLTGEAPYYILLPACAVALMGVFYRRLSGPVLSQRTVAALTVLFAAFAVLDFFYISGSLILAGADFLVLLLCLKLLSLERQKDYIQLYAVSFFILLASTGLSTDVYFLAAFLIFFISLTWALILLTIKGEAEGGKGGARRLRIGRFFFSGTAGLTLLAVFFTVIIFMIIPRVGMGYFSRKAGGLLKSGFSDKVELSSGGEVLLDPAAVMRVEFPGEERPEGPLYFRGRVYDYYNGRGWESSIGVRRLLFRSPDGMFHTGAGKDGRGRLEQEITLEPLDSPVLFSLYPPMEVSGDFRSLYEDGYGALYLQNLPEGRVRYIVYSGNSNLGKGPHAGGGGVSDGYLQLPEGLDRIRALAKEAAGGEGRPFKKARNIEKYLQERYAYSLNPPQGATGDAISAFLFKTKSGYCVHFATAMALMLRAEGIPSRLVSGFLDGEWNAYGKYLLVRQEDAHTWVEAWFPDRGWLAFDPTPSTDKARKNIFSGLLGALDYFKFEWDRWVVFYSARDQAGTARKVFSAFQAAKAKLADADRKLRFEIKMPGLKGAKKKLAFLPVFISLAVLAIYFGRLYLRKTLEKREARTTVAFYEEAVGILRKKGLTRRPGETPSEFAASLAARYGDALSPMACLTETYNHVRFGGNAIASEEEKRAREALSSLRASLKGAMPGRQE